MICLLDANVLIALINPGHVHHDRAGEWFGSPEREFATCPMTQGALMRHYFRDTEKPTASGALELLSGIESMPGHQFWQDQLSFSEVSLAGVMGHRQVTDAYLVALALKHRAKLVTFDVGLSLLRPDATLLVDVASSG